MNPSISLQKLPAQLIAAENFKPYGQVIFPSVDGKGLRQTRTSRI